jgi:hypothetical protein
MAQEAKDAVLSAERRTDALIKDVAAAEQAGYVLVYSSASALASD